MSSPPPRALLVEIVNADQFPGQIRRDLPFLAGALRARGLPLRWVRFGMQTANQLLHDRDEITLSNDELTFLVAVLREHRPTRVLLTHPLAPEQQALLRAACEAPPTFEIIAEGGHDELAYHVEEALEDEAWQPMYCWEPGNAGALVRDKDNVALLLGERCGYSGPLERNPCYASLDADLRAGWSTCTFCGRPQEIASGTPLAWLRRQVLALARDRGPDRPPHSVLLEHVEGARPLTTTLAALAEAGLARSTALFFGVRTDRLGRLEPALREALEASRTTGQRLGTYATGLESFVADELLRYNKGTTPLDGLRAVNLLSELRHDFPDTFWATGLTMILFTPWTTFADLDLNLRLIARLGQADLIGNLFGARLRLHPPLAITALARAEGLLEADEPDPALRLNRRKLFGEELAWRFALPALRPLCRLYVRFGEEHEAVDDDLARQVQATLRATLGAPAADWDARKLDVLIALADEAAVADDPLPEFDLLAAGARRAAERQQRGPAAPRERFRVGLDDLELPALLERLAPLLRAGDPPLVRLRRVAPQAWGAEERAAALRLGLVVATSPEPTDGEGLQLFLALDPATLRRAVLLARAADDPSAPPLRRRAARVELLTRLGWPPCCAGRWADEPWAEPGLAGWGALTRRAEAAGPVTPELDPTLVPDLGVVACGEACEAAATTLGRRLGRLGLDPSAFVDTVALPRLEADPDLAPVRVRVVDRAPAHLVYDPSSVIGAGRWAALLRQGSSLRLRPGQVQVMNAERLVGWRTASHGVWAAAGFEHADEWRELARGVARAVLRQREAQTARASAAHAEQAAIPEGLRVVFQPRRGGAPTSFVVARSKAGEPAYRRVGDLAISHEEGTSSEVLAKLITLVEAAASRTPPPLADPAAWQARLELLLETTRQQRLVTVTVSPRRPNEQ
jgi:hypothetical protein